MPERCLRFREYGSIRCGSSAVLREAFALCHFLSARSPVGTPESLRPPVGRPARVVQALRLRNKGRISLRRCAANPGRAGPRPERRQPVSGGGSRTTAAVIPCRAARPGQPVTALTFRPQATECRRHHRHEAEPQVHLPHAGSASPCGKRCRPGYRFAPRRSGGPRFQEGLPQGVGVKSRRSCFSRSTRTARRLGAPGGIPCARRSRSRRPPPGSGT